MVTPSAVLLDTNVLSELSKTRPDARVMTYLAALPLGNTFISAVSAAEIERGIVKLQDQDPERAQRLRGWLETTVLPKFGSQILPFDLLVAREWGRLLGSQEMTRQPPALLDSLIAATASAHRLLLVTRNTRDFLRFPLAVYDPWTPRPPAPE